MRADRSWAQRGKEREEGDRGKRGESGGAGNGGSKERGRRVEEWSGREKMIANIALEDKERLLIKGQTVSGQRVMTKKMGNGGKWSGRDFAHKDVFLLITVQTLKHQRSTTAGRSRLTEMSREREG